MPELATGRPILEQLDGPPPALPPADESGADQARRQLIGHPDQWMALNPRVKLTEASARRLARSFQRSKPARLDEAAAGRFDARAFQRDDTWLVAAVYQPGKQANRLIERVRLIPGYFRLAYGTGMIVQSVAAGIRRTSARYAWAQELIQFEAIRRLASVEDQH